MLFLNVFHKNLNGVINLNYQEGSAFIIVLIIILVIVPIGLAISNNIITGIRVNTSTEEQAKALNIAEAGFEIIMYDLMSDSITTQEGPIHTTIDLNNLPQVDAGSWSSFQSHLGPSNGSYRYKVEEYTSGPNNGLLKVSIEGKFNEITKGIVARVYPGGSITDIIDRYKLHLVGDELDYPWLETHDKCNGWELDRLITMRNMVELFDFEKFKELTQNSSELRYFQNPGGSYANNNDWAGENIFQRIYKNGAGDVWEDEKSGDIQTEPRREDDYWKNRLGKAPPEPTGKASLPGGLFYLDPLDQGFRLELGKGKLIGPEDDPTVIIVEGDLEIADFSSNMAQIENVYFVVKGQVEFTNYRKNWWGYYKTDNPGNIKTVNSFIYAAKDFKWKVIDSETGEREAANDYGDNNEGVGSIDDDKAAVSGYLNNNLWQGPILTSEKIEVSAKTKAGKPMYDGVSMIWSAFREGLNRQVEMIYPQVISWNEK